MARAKRIKISVPAPKTKAVKLPKGKSAVRSSVKMPVMSVAKVKPIRRKGY